MYFTYNIFAVGITLQFKLMLDNKREEGLSFFPFINTIIYDLFS